MEDPAHEEYCHTQEAVHELADRVASMQSGRKPRVGVRTAGHFEGQEVCKPYNDDRGCTSEASDCPLGRAHVCDVMTPNGKPCGSTEHTRQSHQ